MDFFSFEAALLRLTGALALQTDKEVAAALGMEPSAFNKRKARGSFPEAEVRALAAELHFDADYVITGLAQTAKEFIDAAREGRPLKKVSPGAADLVIHWDQCAPDDQRMLLALAKRLAMGTPPSLTPDGRYPKRVDDTALVLHDKRKKTL